MKKGLLLFTIYLSTLTLQAQHLFPKKLDNCDTKTFCLDCGDEKAEADPKKFAVIANEIKSTGLTKGISGKVIFQVLIDSLGHGCVLSHTDKSDSKISKEITEKLNGFDGWIPAKTDGKLLGKVSVNFEVEIKSGDVMGKMARVDMEAFEKSFDHPKDPQIFNDKYKYKNKNLGKYKITVWNSKNSVLPNNKVDYLTIAQNNILWFTVDEGLYRMEDGKFINSDQNVVDKGKFFGYYNLEADKNNTIWLYGSKGIFSYSDGKWTHHPKEISGIKSTSEIFQDPISQTIYFSTGEGVVKYNNGWDKNIINTAKYPDLPSNHILFAKADSKNRLWIGTYDNGSAMIDTSGKLTRFEDGATLLKGKSIKALAEDEKGNIYFGLYEFANGKERNRNEGIAVLDVKGNWKQYTTKNSGMPHNSISDLLYDKTEKVLWIASTEVGLVRFDLKDEWENYHNLNSDIPTSYISDLEQDNHGNIWIGTRQGLVKLERR